MPDEKNLPGVTNDNPNLPDEEEVDLGALLAAEDEDEAAALEEEPEPAQVPTVEKPAEPTPGTPQPPAATPEQPTGQEEPRFTQKDLERIIGERLQRDRKTQTVAQLEAIAGAPLEKLVEEARRQQIERAQEQYAMTEDEAAAYVQQQEELRTLKAQQEAMSQQQQAMQQMMAYQQEKAKFAGNPLAKKYEREIDEFSGMGSALPYEAAMSYIIGQKVLAGDVLDSVRQAAQAQTLANVQKRAKAAPEAPQGGGAQSTGLTPQQKIIAARLGLSPREYAESLARINKKTRR